MSASWLVRLLVDPGVARDVPVAAWTGIVAVARAEKLAGTLAQRLEGLDLPATLARIIVEERAGHREARRRALWEVEMARRALAPLAAPVILLKGSAFAAAGLDAARGRQIGDLDILVPSGALDRVEAALIAAGWEWAKPDAYDDLYYRRWMHELPPLIHRERDAMIDVHHTILPPTARPTPDAAALIADAVPLGESGVAMLSRADIVVHAAAHLIADGDLSGGLRNLWDIDRLCREFSADDAEYLNGLLARADHHGLSAAVVRTLRLARQIFSTPVPRGLVPDDTVSDRLFRRRLLARDEWGRGTRPATRAAFYIRSHAMRMPPALLARHLWIKWRKRAPA